MIGGERRLLTIEVKGQWHPELFTGAAEQLDTRYSSHPDAERQGIYLVLWFGAQEKVAGRVNTDYKTPEELRAVIIAQMPQDLHGRIDVQMIDLSRSVAKPATLKPAAKKRAAKKPAAKKSATARKKASPTA
ncbi:hypothetical protein [Mesorhizobium carmichaelinearum]|uniref:hypothetical protein n=1 Tax=Mesorhizobium carmichaelinearum TaxID=1208188 RepID=UPI000BA3B3D4|nr:hypothetical protein [Mesorhizobium carmichaelinearum]